MQISPTMVLPLVSLLAVAAPAPQDEAALRTALEGTEVTVLVDMPGTHSGIDLYPEHNPKLDRGETEDRIRDNGVAIRRGSKATITLIKVKDEHIEFQLDGGGYGVFGDSTATRQYVSKADETQRELDLKEEIRDEDDFLRKQRLERELRDLQDRRERDYQRDRRAAEDRYRRDLETEQRNRLRGGSRFNIRYDRDVSPNVLTPEGIAAALDGFVDFGTEVDSEVTYTGTRDAGRTDTRAGGGGRDTGRQLLPVAKGMSRADVERVFGEAASCTQSEEGRLQTLVCGYELDGATAEVTFVNDATVSFLIVSR